MQFIRSIVLLMAITTVGCSAQQFTQADLTGNWTGTMGNPNPNGPLGIYGYYTLSFTVDAVGNVLGQYQHYVYPMPMCPSPQGPYPTPFLSGRLTLVDGTSGVVNGTLVINNEAVCAIITTSLSSQVDTKLTQPGLQGAANRLTGTFVDLASPSNPGMPLDVSGGSVPPVFKQSDLTGIWSGTYLWNDGTGTLPFPATIPSIQFAVDAQGNISTNGFSGTLTVDASGVVSGSITDAAVGTLTITPAANVHLQSPGLNGLPFRIITPAPFVGFNVDISGPAAPPPPPPPPPAPTITSPQVAIGYVGAPFSYSITASGPSPITFGAKNLPAGLALSGGMISGMPVEPGSTPVTLTATNPNGSTSVVITIAIGPATSQIPNPSGGLPPSIASQPATNTPIAAVGDTVTFTVAAGDSSGSALTYTWNFGDGTTQAGGSTISHVYASGGPYLVSVTVSNGTSASTSSQVPIDIADGRVDLGSVSLSAAHGKFGFTLVVPPTFPKHGVKSQRVLGTLSDGTKYSNLKLRGKTSATGAFTFTLEFTSRKPALTKRIIYTYALTK